MNNRYSNKIPRVLMMSLAVLLGTTAMTASFATQALAQDRDDDMEFMLEDIVVTGSRIVRRDFESVSPIVTVDERLFDHSATLAIEMQLNKLPQFTPTMDVPTFGGDIQPSARNVPGEATVALRGLGANRSLTLINGRRATPSGGMMYVDINTIPVAAIERVEAISGGASAVYGADAMAGVVNFIMKDDFEGFEVDFQSGITQEGDNFEYQISGVMGANVGDDRGNVMISFSYNDRDEARQRDRNFYRELWADTSIRGTQFFPRFSGFFVGVDPTTEVDYPFFPGGCAMFGVCTNPNNFPDVDVVNSVIDGATFTEMTEDLVIFVDDYGNAFTGFDDGEEGVSGADIVDGYNVILQDDGLYGYNNTTGYLVLPMNRYNLYTNGNFEITDWIGAFFTGYFAKSQTKTTQEASPITQGWRFYIDYPDNKDYMPEELVEILDSRPYPDAPFLLKAFLPFDRTGFSEVYTYNFTTGLEGTIPRTDWTWELFVSQGEAESTSIMEGFGSLQRFDAMMNAGPNFGMGAEIQGNQGPPNNGFGAATGTCTSGLNPFDWDSVSEDCWNAVLADIKTKSVMEQTIWETNLQGAIMDLPAGEMRGAVGASIRKNVYYYNNETMTVEGRSFIEQALGLYPSDNTKGSIRTKELYGELLVPVLSDIPAIKQLSLEFGGRRSDYTTTGSSYTYRALADWRANDWLRFRGGYNRAERAPNMAELFLAPEQTFDFFGAMRGDPCAVTNTQPYGANSEYNENWAQVIELCGQLMEASGADNADDTFYGADYRDVMAGAEVTGMWATWMEGFVLGGMFPHLVGNPDIHPETADTYTVGIVIDSNFENPWLSDLRVSLDYYSIAVEEAIGLQSADLVMQQCFDPIFNPTYDPNSAYCAGAPRDQSGLVGQMDKTYVNSGEFETSGIDLQVNWGKDAGPGRVGVNTTVNYLLDKSSNAVVGVLPTYDYTGTTGPNENGLDGNSYELRARTEVSYTYQDLRVALGWQFYDSLELSTAVTNPEGTTLTGLPTYHLFNLNGSYSLTNNMFLRFGIENLFNKEPPLYFRDTDPEEDMPGGMYNVFVYDMYGRRFYLGARVDFD